MELELYSRDGVRLFLEGVLADGRFRLVQLRLTGGGGLDERFKIDTDSYVDVANVEEAAGVLRFRYGAADLWLGVTLVAEQLTWFGREIADDYAVGLDLHVGTAAGRGAPYLIFWFEGRMALGAQGLVADASVRLEATIEDLHGASPSLGVVPPDLGFGWPTLGVAWSTFPVLPDAFVLPAWNGALGDLGLSFAWDGLRLGAIAARLALDLTGLRVGLATPSLGIDLHLEIGTNGLELNDSWLAFAFASTTRISIPAWHADDRCLALRLRGPHLESLLRLLAPDVDLPAPNEITLRLLWDTLIPVAGDKLEPGFELRIDWPIGGARWGLPGVFVELDAGGFATLLLTSTESTTDLRLLVTLAQGTGVRLGIAFGLQEDNAAPEYHRSPQDDHLFALVLEAKEAATVSLVSLPLGGSGRLGFFDGFDPPLAHLDFTAPDLCDPSGETRAGLRTDAWNLYLRLPPIPVELPILRSEAGKQALSIRLEDAPGARIDFASVDGMYQPRMELDLFVRLQLDQLYASASAKLAFDLASLAFAVTGPETIVFNTTPLTNQHFLGLVWTLDPNPDGALFELGIRGGFAIRQSPGSLITAAFAAATSSDEPIVFAVEGFAIGPRGVNFDASVTAKPARLNGLETRFQFTGGRIEMRDSRTTGFSLTGSGPLPPALVGNATVDISLQFAQDEAGRLRLVAGGAALRGRKVLHCPGTRFSFSIDGIGLRFFDDGGYHFYVTLTGTVRFVLAPGDSADGPLGLLPSIEMQMVDCPLTSDVSVLAHHIEFLVELPQKKQFNFLGCFQFEVRGIGFVPDARAQFGDRTSAMKLTGQIKFADGEGDVIDARVDFHNLLIGLPAPGSFAPRLHCKEIGVKLRSGDAFELSGAVELLDGTEIQPGWRADGFAGRGSIAIKGLPEIAANFAFVRVTSDGGLTWKRAWFVYAELRRLSLRIPIINVFLREVGLGFGYRYTLASIQTADKVDDARTLLKLLKELANTQANLSERGAWRLDVEPDGEHARWTVALRGLIAQNSAAKGIADWDDRSEREIPSAFLLDVVAALRSDFTFYMTARGWLFTNYADFVHDTNGVRSKPLLKGFILLSPARKRLLANLSSNPDAAFGDHPPVLEIIKKAVVNSRFSATLLIEPGLFHMELGWPDQLRWQAKLGPLDASFRGGMLYRISRTEMVYGQSYVAHATLDIRAEANLGFVGARLSARASVAFGARMIGVIGFDRPLERSGLYGAVGIEIQTHVSLQFWLRIKIGWFKIRIQLNFDFHLCFTALVEVGGTFGDAIGARGTATLSLSIMGHQLRLGMHVGLNEAAVNTARDLTAPFLNVGLEAQEVEPLPGATSPQAVRAPVAAALVKSLVAETLAAETEGDNELAGGRYSILWIDRSNVADRSYFVLIPSGGQRGFLPPPPPFKHVGEPPPTDIHWCPPSVVGIERYAAGGWKPTDTNAFSWQVAWGATYEYDFLDGGSTSVTNVATLAELLRYAFVPKLRELQPEDGLGAFWLKEHPSMDDAAPVAGDPRVHHPSQSSYEAAVRGAAEQIEGSPYLRSDPRMAYELQLRTASDPTTTIYAKNGEHPGEADEAKLAETVHEQHATELRGLLVQRLMRDVEAIAASSKDDAAEGTLAAHCGLVFRVTGEPPAWLQEASGAAGWIVQRTTVEPITIAPDAPRPSGAHDVTVFNPSEKSFDKRRPDFARVKHFASARTVAITWDLVWPRTVREEEPEPEHFVRHYQIVRTPLGDAARQREFTVKPATVLLRNPDQTLHALPPRFKFVDQFDDEPGDADGLRYLYVITPIDLQGKPGTSLSLVAVRRPDAPPPPLAEPRLIVTYLTPDIPAPVPETDSSPLVMEPETIRLECKLPASSEDATVIVDKVRLVFRAEPTLPMGMYAVDADVAAGGRRGVPTSNARRLAGDIAVELAAFEVTLPGGVAEESVLSANVSLSQLTGVFPDAGWRPQAWRVFVQRVSAATNVAGSLVPVELVLRWTPTTASEVFEERRPELLEWLPPPIRFATISSRDATVDVQFAAVPRHVVVEDDALGCFDLDLASDTGIRFQRHPDRIRTLRFRWNPGTSARAWGGAALRAGFRLLEFDADAHTSEVLDELAGDGAKLVALTRQARAIRLLADEDRPMRPDRNTDADLWEAWYPSRSRRVGPDEGAKKHAEKQWYSGRESVLVWPRDSARWPGRTWGPRTAENLKFQKAPPDAVDSADPRTWIGGDVGGLAVGQLVGYHQIVNPANRIEFRVVAVRADMCQLDRELTDQIDGPSVLEPLDVGAFRPEAAFGDFRGALQRQNVKDVEQLWFNGSGVGALWPGCRVELPGLENFSASVIEVRADRVRLEASSLPDKADTLRLRRRLTHVPASLATLHRWEVGSDADIFPRGTTLYVRVSGFASPRNNGLKRVDLAGTALVFEEGSFDPTYEPSALVAPPVVPTLVVELAKPSHQHPFLAKLIEDLCNEADAVAQISPERQGMIGCVADIVEPPPISASEVGALLDGYAPEPDPYGWNALKAIGLSAAFTLRSRYTGGPLVTTNGEVRALLRVVLLRYPATTEVTRMLRHLHVEELYQPARAIRLSGDAHDVPDADDLLSLTQVSLRPAIRQTWGYWKIVVARPPGGPTLTVNVTVDANIACSLREPWGARTVAIAAQQKKETTRIDLGASPRPALVLLVRAQLGRANDTRVNVHWRDGALDVSVGIDDDGPIPEDVLLQPIEPTDPIVAPFEPFDFKTWKDGAPAETAELERYLLAVLPAEPGRNAPSLVEATRTRLPGWVVRFFRHGGDVLSPVPGNPRAARIGATGAGPWLATGYPRAASPALVGITPAGWSECHQLILDDWGHTYRYYLVPEGRYDGVWLALAHSRLLVPDETTRRSNIEKLSSFVAPIAGAGGLDVVLDRIHPLASPTVLSSRRLDEGEQAGRTWEVLVEKHAEQVLVERNRTLVRNLGYRQNAHALLRSYAYATEHAKLIAALSAADRPLRPVVSSAAQLPGHGQDLGDLEGDSVERDFAQRVDTNARSVVAHHLRELPFFYEHRLLLIAQAIAVHSDVTEVRSRAFRSRTPAPGAFAARFQGGDANPRTLHLTLFLASSWDCLPDAERRRWTIEDPGSREGLAQAGRKPASLPDPEVVYEIVLQHPSGVAEVVAAFEFDPATGAYRARKVGDLFTSEAGEIQIPEHLADVDAAQFWLPIRLSATDKLAMREPLAIAVADARAPSVGSVVGSSGDRVELRRFGALTAADIRELVEHTDPEFAAALEALVDADIEVAYAPVGLEELAQLHPDIEIAPKSITWKGDATVDELETLRRWTAISPYRTTLAMLREALAQGAVGATVPITEPFRRPPVPASLADRLVFGHGQLRARAWMPRADAETLHRAATTAPQRDAVLRMFRASISAGLGGGTLYVRARRGLDAPARHLLPEVML